ncbi:MAG: PEGA domain-containing protein [Hydrogenothermaceae bacterium]
MAKKGLVMLLFFIFSALILSSCEGKGKIQINNPPGAQVYINGKLVGKTPLELELKEGKYDITVATTEFDRDTQKGVWVYYDKVTKLDFNPKPTGILKADTIPQGAIVMEGRYAIGTTPFRDYLPVGQHLIIFKLGSVGASRKVLIEYGKESSLVVNLQKAVIHFDGNPQDAILYIDGKQIGSFPQDVEIEEGIHKFAVEKDVYKDEFTLKVKKGDEFKVKFTLEEVQLPPVQAYGPLAFTSDYRYFISLGKAGIYFWDLKDLKPHISLWDPEDVRNFDKFSTFAVSEDGKMTTGLKPVKTLAYKYKDMKNPLKILLWDNTTASVKLNKLVDMTADFITFGKSSNAVYLFDKSGKGVVLDSKTANKIKDISVGESITALKTINNKIYIGTASGKLLVLDTQSDNIENQQFIHTGSINEIQTSKNKDILVTASSDKTVKVIKLADMSVQKSLSISTIPISVNISPSLTKIIVGRADRTAEVLSIDGGKLYSISLGYSPVSVGFANEDITITASSKENPMINLWYQGHLLRKWVQTVE